MKLITLFLFSCVAFAAKPDLFLLKKYDETKNIIGWVVSEKLDGVRGFWDGKRLLTRSGNELYPPKWFLENYPPFAIDGELWTKRADFENIVSIVRSKNSNIRWQDITHNIFEVPNQSGGVLQRLDILSKYLQQNPSKFIKIIEQLPIKSKKQIKLLLDKVVSNNGEGLVVRNPNTPYQVGRLSNALKLKKYIDDECMVIEILKGKGKFFNKMGSIKCRLKNNDIVKIGSGFTDLEREYFVKIGTKITFKYYGRTKKGKYKYPVFLRIQHK